MKVVKSGPEYASDFLETDYQQLSSMLYIKETPVTFSIAELRDN